MAEGFPLPRTAVPILAVISADHAATKTTMERLLHHTLQEFDQFANKRGGCVDNKHWKPLTSNDRLTIYHEQQNGSVRADLALSLNDATISCPTSRKIMAGLDAPHLLLTGQVSGQMEDAMEAVITQNQQDMALVMTFLHDSISDCGIIHTLEAPTEAEPYHYLGYKYYLKKAPTSSRLIKHRDCVYAEYTGITTIQSTGERVGFHIIHSVDISGFPDPVSRPSVTMLQSLRYIYRQGSNNMVDVFCLGNMDLGAHIPKSLASVWITDTIFSWTRLVDCAEVKRLTQMMNLNIRMTTVHTKAKECSVCYHRRSFIHLFGSISFSMCHVCGQYMCSRCRLTKQVFIRDRTLGVLEKVNCCKNCVLTPNNSMENKTDQWKRQLDRRRASTVTSNESDASVLSDENMNSNYTRTSERLSRLSRRISKTGDGLRHEATPPSPNALNQISTKRWIPLAVQEVQAQAAKAQQQHQREQQQQHLQRSEKQDQYHERSHPHIKRTQSHPSLRTNLVHDYTNALSIVETAPTTIRHHLQSDSNLYCYPNSVRTPQNRLIARMVQLNQVAELTYQATQRNATLLVERSQVANEAK